MSEFRCVENGRVWHPYSVQFESPDGTYQCEVWAISVEHAELQLQALKETGRIVGQIIGRERA